jgi:hypothetical protein
VAFLRFLVIVLILLNLLVLAAWQGWLGQGGSQGEPQRLTNQLAPERLQLLDDRPPAVEQAPTSPSADVVTTTPAVEPAEPLASAATDVGGAPETAPAVVDTAAVPPEAPSAEPAPVATPPACAAFAALDDEQAALVMGDALARPGLETKDIPSTEVTSWWVHIPSQGSREAAERKVVELRALGVKDLFASGEKSARPFTVSLGLFKSAESAAEQQRRLEAKGVRGIAIEERGQTNHRVEVRGPADVVTVWASDWSGRLSGASRLDCRP